MKNLVKDYVKDIYRTNKHNLKKESIKQNNYPCIKIKRAFFMGLKALSIQKLYQTHHKTLIEMVLIILQQKRLAFYL